MHKDTELLIAAKAGDETAFEEIVMRYSGLIWRGYKQQSMRTATVDWQHEARIVLFNCLQRISYLNWGILTSYYQQALFHHPATLWRQEEKRAMITKEALELGTVSTEGVVVTEPELQLHLFCEEMVTQLLPDQYQLLLLRAEGYSVKECATQLHKSKSWCYLTLKEIRYYCEKWTRG